MSKLTVPRRLSRNHVRGDFRVRCSLCGNIFHRSVCIRDNGLLRCPDDQKGREAVELEQANADAAMSSQKTPFIQDGGGGDTYNLDVVHRTTYDDITNIG